MSDYGFVYVMQSDAMNGVYKVGYTTRSVFKRAEELSLGTGVPDSYSPAYYLESSEVRLLERRVHQSLLNYRVSPFREFFRCPMRLIIECIREQTEDRLAEYISDMAEEALRPGSISPKNPVWFERSLYHTDAFAEFESMRLPGQRMRGVFALDLSEVK